MGLQLGRPSRLVPAIEPDTPSEPTSACRRMGSQRCSRRTGGDGRVAGGGWSGRSLPARLLPLGPGYREITWSELRSALVNEAVAWRRDQQLAAVLRSPADVEPSRRGASVGVDRPPVAKRIRWSAVRQRRRANVEPRLGAGTVDRIGPGSDMVRFRDHRGRRRFDRRHVSRCSRHPRVRHTRAPCDD